MVRSVRSRRARFALVGAVLAALALVSAAFWPAGSTHTPTGSATPTAPPDAAPDAADAAPPAALDRTADRASRGGAPRAAPPEASPPPPETPDAIPEGGVVVTTGTCEASFYWEPQPTASGEVFDPEAMTAAHKTWDFNTRVRVTNQANGESVVVRINDRGPYIDGRCLDLTRGAFREIAPLDQGVATVTYEVLE